MSKQGGGHRIQYEYARRGRQIQYENYPSYVLMSEVEPARAVGGRSGNSCKTGKTGKLLLLPKVLIS